MSKALTGAAELAGAVGMGALAFFDPAVLALHGYGDAMVSLGLAGLGTEAGAIAQELTANRGQNITTRQPAAFRQIVYGCQRIGGTLIYPSTTGSKKDQYNRVIVLSAKQLSAITALYLDGRQVYWIPGRTGYTTYGASNFGGDSDGSDHTGPDGTTYNFGDSQVYCEVRFGNQADGDVITGLTANDPAWAASAQGSPWVGGCAYAYLKIEYNQTNFPSDPEIRFTVLGKPVYDPRTGLTGYSHNPALILNDILTDPDYGLNDSTVNQAQLIAAANICEEQVALAAGGTEDRYACHWHYDTSTADGDVLNTVLATMGGRLCRIGGQWYIFPAAYIAPSASYGADNLTGPVQWSGKRATRELFNEVRGTYTAANFPYNIAGNYYDTNGFADGMIQNNFGFAFQPSNYPPYLLDANHGFASNQYLNEDGGVLLTKELGFPAVLSIAQSQRLAKIALLRNRQQGTGTLPMNLAAFGLQCCDTFQMTFAQEGWTDKVLEVSATQFLLDNGNGQSPKISLSLGVQETAASVYEWETTEEQTVYDVPAMTQAGYTVAPPTDMELISSAATALVQPDGSVIPRIKVTWDTPEDVLVTAIRMRYRLSGASTWTDAGTVDVALNAGYISPIVSGQSYDLAICSVRSSGSTSVWVEIDAFAADLVFSVQTQAGIGIGSLQALANTNGTAQVVCNPFTAPIGNMLVSYFPAGAVPISTDGTSGGSGSALTQQTKYYVYVVDPTAAGGDLTPVATTNPADFRGKVGYWLIDSIVTPYAAAGSTSRIYPRFGNDSGTATTSNPGQAFDGDSSTSALVQGSASSTYVDVVGGEPNSNSNVCDFTLSGFPAIITTVALNLYINLAVSMTVHGEASDGTVAVNATIAGTMSVVETFTAAAAQQVLTVAIPDGTDLSSVVLEVVATPGTTDADSTTRISYSWAKASLTEVYIAN